MHSNAFLYCGYAVAGTFAVQALEQWQDQPMNRRKGETFSTEERASDSSRWKWSLQFRNGDDPTLTPSKDPSEPYYNLVISGYRDSHAEERLRKNGSAAQCQSADEGVSRSGVHVGKSSSSGAEIREFTFNIDLSRVGGMIFFSSFFNGPANVLLYPFYSRVFGAAVSRCVLFDQTIYMPIVAIPACYYLNGFVKNWAMRDPRIDESKEVGDVENQPYSIGECFNEITSDMKERFVSTWLLTMCIWIPAESINMRFTPLHLRSAVAGAVGLLWTTGMAAWTHAGPRSLMESSMESSLESSIEAWVAMKTVLARVSDTSFL